LGYNHGAILSSDGQVYTFGAGEWGQLGHGNKENQVCPQEIITYSICNFSPYLN
jgi:alpha-tubulin suppressor-like RCC1 family protein